MKLYGVLVLLVTLSAAYGLQCYVCGNVKPSACTVKQTCPAGSDRCASVECEGLVSKSCFFSTGCQYPIKCCEKDLCNGDFKNAIDSVTDSVPDIDTSSAIPTGSSVLLLLVSSAITSVFL